MKDIRQKSVGRVRWVLRFGILNELIRSEALSRLDSVELRLEGRIMPLTQSNARQSPTTMSTLFGKTFLNEPGG